MTELEVLKSQAKSGETQFYLMQRGSFFHAYGCGVFALARVTGFRVLRKQRKAGEVLTCGFPVASLQRVLELLRKSGADVEERSPQLLLFSGIDGTPDETLVSQARTPALQDAVNSQTTANYGWLADEIKAFNLMQSTPMEALAFLSRLQGTIARTDKPGPQRAE